MSKGVVDPDESAEITAEDVKSFREGERFKQSKALASGKLTFDNYVEDFQKLQASFRIELRTSDAGKVVGAYGALRMLSIWLIGLVGGTAYKLAAG